MCVFCTEELQQQHEVLRVVGRQAQASEHVLLLEERCARLEGEPTGGAVSVI